MLTSSKNNGMQGLVSNNNMNDGYNYNVPQVDKRFKQLSSSEDDDNAKVISQYDSKFFEYLVRLAKTLGGDKINLDDVKDNLDLLERIKKANEREYMDTLLHPEFTKGVKIPSPMPVPSSSFQMHQSTIISTNSLGHASMIWNPVFLESAGTQSTFFINNDLTLTGNAPSNFFRAVQLGQTIPAVYNEYRVVSASIVVKYVGRLDIVQGVIGGSIIFDQNITATAFNGVNANLQKYGDFNLAMDAYYTQENMALNGCRCLYFPLDNTFEQYIPLNTAKTGFGVNIYIYGGVPSAAAYKVDLFVNYECLADSTFLHYIPSSCTPSYEDKTAAVSVVQSRPITNEDEYKTRGGKKGGNFWQDLKSTVGSVIPGIAQLAGALFPQAKGVIGTIGNVFR